MKEYHKTQDYKRPNKYQTHKSTNLKNQNKYSAYRESAPTFTSAIYNIM
jgi:hypothetical protein